MSNTKDVQRPKSSLKLNKGQTKTKKKEVVRIENGLIYVQSTFNNTIVTATDNDGNVLNWSSAGIAGFKGTKKSTPFAATMAMNNLLEKIKPIGLRKIKVLVSGVGSGRDAAIRALNSANLEIAGIQDITPIPHNGCRAKKARRV